MLCRAVTLLSLAVVVAGLLPCKIDLKIRSKTEKKFRVDVFVPSLKVKADNILFDGVDQNKKVMVEGPDCDSKKWLIQTYKWDEETKDWAQAKNITGKFFGTGMIRFVVGDELLPTLKDTNGVWITESELIG